MSANQVSSLPRLVDLSIGTPETGAINFNALHRLLHKIVARLSKTTGDHLQLDIDEAFHSTEAVPNTNLPNITIPTVSTADKNYRLSASSTFTSNSVTDSKVATDGKQTHSLEDKVNHLEQLIFTFLPKLPSTKDISAVVKSEKPVLDLWQYNIVSQRSETNEKGVQSVSTYRSSNYLYYINYISILYKYKMNCV